MTTPTPADDARAERPLRCDGTPHPEDAIPPLSEHDYRFDGDDPYVVCARCGERRDALTGDVLAAGRAETTTGHGPDWSDWQDGDDGDTCKCGYNGTSRECADSRRAETTTATTEDAARVLYESGTGFKLTKGKPWEELAESSRNSQRRLAQALADAGLLATARTRPTETEWGVIGDDDGPWVADLPEATREEAEAYQANYGGTVVRREITAWTEDVQ